MVESTLRENYLKTDTFHSIHLNTPYSTSSNLNYNKDVEIEYPNQKCLEAYIRGDSMTKQDEKLALKMLKSISASELYKTVENSLDSICKFSFNCKCQTCNNYNSAYLNCDLRRNKSNISDVSKNNNIETQIQSPYLNNQNLFKYIDSLKVSVGSLDINDIGWQKICATLTKNKPSHLINYFLEYRIPDCLRVTSKQSKVDSGIESNNVRLCAKKLNNAIYFKHVALHNLKHLTDLNICNTLIQFKITFRGYAQKQFHLLGCATFNFGELLLQKNLTCYKGLSLEINNNTPIVVGTLKVLFQLGCGRLYFGPEFIGM